MSSKTMLGLQMVNLALMVTGLIMLNTSFHTDMKNWSVPNVNIISSLVDDIHIITNKTSNTDNDTSLTLRFDWTQLKPISTLAKNVSRHQREMCELPLGFHEHRPLSGIGSNLHVWSQAICVGMERGYRLYTNSIWNAVDEELCNVDEMISSMTCYFPKSELVCPNDVPRTRIRSRNGWTERTYSMEWFQMDPNNPTPPTESLHSLTESYWQKVGPWVNGLKNGCPGMMDQYNVTDLRAGIIEYLFSPVSNTLQNEAKRQLHILFGKNGKAPPNLITVNIRWGDKWREMKVVSIEEYIQAVKSLINKRMISDKTYYNDGVHIYVASEDPEAIKQFREGSPENWMIYDDVYLQMYGTDRSTEKNTNDQHIVISKRYKGRPGLVSLGSLLVSMEANDYVLTPGSNWSRLINELRKTVIDMRCNNCTKAIFLGDDMEWR